MTFLPRTLLAASLLLIGTSKLFDWDSHQIVSNGNIVSFVTHPSTLIAVAVVECLTGILLASKFWRHGALMAISLVTLLWISVLALLRLGVSPEHCGCLGAAELTTTAHFALLAGLYSLALATIIESRRIPD